MLRRFITFLPTLLAAYVSLWWAYDLLAVRDLTGAYHYYGSIPISFVENVMSVLWLAGGVAMIGGVGCGKEILTRIGYAFSGFGWLFFSIGSMLAPLLPDAQQGLAGSSALTPAHGYGLLAVWMLLTALTEWGGDLDPHD